MLINRKEKVGIKNLKNPKAFTDYSKTIDDVYENLENHNPTKKRKVLIVFDNMIADMKPDQKKIISIVTELFLRGRKCNILLVFLSKYYLKVSKTTITHYSILKILDKK